MSHVPESGTEACGERTGVSVREDTLFKASLPARRSHRRLSPHATERPCGVETSTFIPDVDFQAGLRSENQQTPRQEACASRHQMVPGLVMASPDDAS